MRIAGTKYAYTFAAGHSSYEAHAWTGSPRPYISAVKDGLYKLAHLLGLAMIGRHPATEQPYELVPTQPSQR